MWSQGWWEDNVSDGELARMMELYEDDFLEDVSDEELLCMEKEGTPLFNFEVATIGELQKFKNTMLKQRVRTKKKASAGGKGGR